MICLFRTSQMLYHLDSVHNQKRSHKCNVCGKSFYKRSDLKTHEASVHMKLKIHKCDECQKTFSHVSNLNRHKLTHSKEKPYSCSLCHVRCGQLATLRNHQKKHHGQRHHQEDSSSKVRYFHCKVCSEKFQFKSDLDLHLASSHHNQTRPYECKKCGQSYKALSDVSQHECRTFRHKIIRPQSSSIPIAPEQEETDSIPLTDLPGLETKQTEQETPEGEKSVATLTIPPDIPVLRDVEFLPVNQDAENEEEELILNVTGSESLIQALSSGQDHTPLSEAAGIVGSTEVTIVQVEGLNWVVESVSNQHSEGEAQLEPALVQDPPVQSKEHIVIEATTTSSEPEVVLKPALKSTISMPANRLKTGEEAKKSRSHHKEGHHECETCGKVFKRLDSFKQHLIIHGNGQPVSCKFCGQTFAWKSTLRRHLDRFHNGNSTSSFLCEVCDRSFKTSTHRKTHIERDHMKIRKYKCEFCDKGFYAQHDLGTHLRVHTGERPYGCDHCPKKFIHSSHKLRHQRSCRAKQQLKL